MLQLALLFLIGALVAAALGFHQRGGGGVTHRLVRLRLLVLSVIALILGSMRTGSSVWPGSLNTMQKLGPVFSSRRALLYYPCSEDTPGSECYPVA